MCQNYTVNNLNNERRKQLCCKTSLCNNPKNYLIKKHKAFYNLSSVYFEPLRPQPVDFYNYDKTPSKCNSITYWTHYNLLKASSNENPTCCLVN